MPAFNLSRTKVQLKLAVERTKMLQHKKEAIAKKDRRDIANLVERGKLETARIKTEGIIAEDVSTCVGSLLGLKAPDSMHDTFTDSHRAARDSGALL